MHINNQCTSDCRRVGCPDECQNECCVELTEETNNTYKQPIEAPSKLVHIISNDWFGLTIIGLFILFFLYVLQINN